jgi:hypothetical protein
MKQTITLYIILISLLVFPFLTHAQFSVVKGKVTDEKTSDPLPYVNIGVKGQAGGTFTDGNGAFHLELPKGAYTLMISYVGYDQIERPFTCDGKKEVLMNLLPTLSGRISIETGPCSKGVRIRVRAEPDGKALGPEEQSLKANRMEIVAQRLGDMGGTLAVGEQGALFDIELPAVMREDSPH